MTSTAGFPSAAADSIRTHLTEICSVPDETYSWENPRRFSGYAKRLQLVLNHILRSESSSSASSPSVHTALKGVAGDLEKSRETLSVYRSKCKIYVLINCESLCASLQERTLAIGGWLALLDSDLVDSPDVHKKAVDLSREMKQARFKVTEIEERVHCMLQKEAEGRPSSKAVESAIIMDLARGLGIDLDNHAELEKQIKLLKNDVAGMSSVAERRILLSLERIFDNWLIEPDTAAARGVSDLDFEGDAHIQPFKNFICPLTKEVMVDPVVLLSSQTYERSAIEHWFQRCIEDGRDPTCPVTGQVLKSLEVKPNIGLAGTIEEWINRNVDIHIKLAVQYLSADSLQVDCIECVLDNIYKVSEEHPSCRYKIRNAGVIDLIVKMLKKNSKSMGSCLRSKALMALLSMTKDEESKLTMLEEGMTRLAIHSLVGSMEKEREYAIKILLEFSSDAAFCAKFASEKGALVLLSSLAGDLQHPSLSNLAEEVLLRVEKVEENVQHLAAAGRFEPLLNRLREGTIDVRIEMASMLGSMTLTNNSKEHIARQAAKILVDMLSKREGRLASLQALYNLSSLDDNATILVESGILIALVDILFRNQGGHLEMMELAASTIAHIVSKPGHWELAAVSKEGFSMQSKFVVLNLLEFIPHASLKGQVAGFQILCGIASSPQASESVATHINSAGGIPMVLSFLGHPEADHRIYAFKLTRILSERLSLILADELRTSDNFPLLKEKLLNTQYTDGERSEAACILANLPLTDDEVKTVLGTSLIGWTINAVKERSQSSSGRTSRSTSTVVDGLLGLLLHFVNCRDPAVMDAVQEHRLMTVFREQLHVSLQPRVKQQAALGLKYLSESARTLVIPTDMEPPPRGFFSSLILMCGKAPKVPLTCPIHCAPCEEDSQVCLLKSNCIKPLVDLVTDEDTKVQIAAVEALSTLLYDNSTNLKRAVDELEQQGVVEVVIALFKEVRTGELQEKTICMVEKILRVESQSHRHSVDQSLVRALVESFKHGTPNTKRHARDALTNLKQLSGIGSKTSSQTPARRLGTDH